MTHGALEGAPELVESFDGTPIAARISRGRSGLPLLISNGIGANMALWRSTLASMEPARTVVMWDHRGLYESGDPASDRMDPAAHALDALAVLDYFGIQRCHVASWSNGARIALELARRHSEKLTALALVNGGQGTTLTRLVRHLEPSAALPWLAGLAKRMSPQLQAGFRALVARPTFAGIVRQSGLIAPSADIDALVELFEGMASCELNNLLAAYEAVARDNARHLLRGIPAPVLLIAGASDSFSPVRLIEEMEELLPNASLQVYDKATHYLPIEHPERLAADLSDFFARYDDPRIP